ncbi:hypothetical protein [Piscirickettsia litoralis]|uniref:HTH cro/C1-type domain-containing protein n=1 Tax=Piscirickettsia litoralis TaxID=1891921 RepID=A0ABX2ZYE0_9GAMM|nr:hypothetical protein [Piscirickettsia litoralis]ODN41518.1 hypothetical protein BGC07_15535 [Piscirickettsia litoralis]
MGIVERLNFTLQWLNVENTRKDRESALSLITGRSIRTVEEWLYGSAFPSSKYLKKIAAYTNLRYSWLQHGEGKAFYYKKNMMPQTHGESLIIPIIDWYETGKLDILTYKADLYVNVHRDNIDLSITDDYTDLFAVMAEEQDKEESVGLEVGDFLVCKPLLPQSVPPTGARVICHPINMDRPIFREYRINSQGEYYIADAPFIRPIRKSKPSEIKARVIGCHANFT